MAPDKKFKPATDQLTIWIYVLIASSCGQPLSSIAQHQDFLKTSWLRDCPLTLPFHSPGIWILAWHQPEATAAKMTKPGVFSLVPLTPAARKIVDMSENARFREQTRGTKSLVVFLNYMSRIRGKLIAIGRDPRVNDVILPSEFPR